MKVHKRKRRQARHGKYDDLLCYEYLVVDVDSSYWWKKVNCKECLKHKPKKNNPDCNECGSVCIEVKKSKGNIICPDKEGE